MMAHTNRTASASHRRWRQRLITQAQQQGQTECPLCGATITWGTHDLPTSPEADHITPVSRGGLNTLDNGQIICRTCNRSKGNRSEPNIKFQQQTTKTLIPW
ncbi:HNH endonuclease [Propionibacterium phage PHL082M03]|uniref:Putative endonuclease n=2 Tax=Pahexavirus PHL082M03 TaxID=1982281 RepID=A0A0E3DMC8_9CAUD|nr:HNH endonuclease [Propionibacterium phage PHL082M03]AII29081.1 putative endonuclease [Propionibacterium phage PHL082M00]AII29173.1 putative endonuclease [Propionibacterium phage PHL082M03]AII29219.1 putative endonuclease [Propionibacterium phage PHL082M04]